MKKGNVKINQSLIEKIKPNSNVLITWGGGKDSTTVLLLAAAYATHGFFNKLTIATFENYLSTKSVLKNRATLMICLDKLNINYELITHDFGGKEVVYELYKQSLLKTGLFRSVCTICNIMADKLEKSVINNKNNINYIITGNSSDELENFNQWEEVLGFENRSNKNRKYNSIFGWSKTYDKWLDYFSKGSKLSSQEVDRFRLNIPHEGDNAVNVLNLSLFKYHPGFNDPRNRLQFISDYGWQLPPVEEGVIGTETDCKFSAIMYGLSILKNRDYFSELGDIESLNKMPKELLYRGIKKTDRFMDITKRFLAEIGLRQNQWIKSPIEDIKEKSLLDYLDKCLLPVR